MDGCGWQRALRRSFLGEDEGSALERVLTGAARAQPHASFSASQSLLTGEHGVAQAPMPWVHGSHPALPGLHYTANPELTTGSGRQASAEARL